MLAINQLAWLADAPIGAVSGWDRHGFLRGVWPVWEGVGMLRAIDPRRLVLADAGAPENL